jgi:hypothetical protein
VETSGRMNTLVLIFFKPLKEAVVFMEGKGNFIAG